VTSCVKAAPPPVNLAVPAKIRSHDRHLTSELERRVQTQFSVIVPVFNEAPLIRLFLQQLHERAPGAEIIVADGGSSDGTAQLAAGLCDQLVESERNRGMQMNVGARVACGDILWFVHVDAEVPSGCLDEIARIVDDPNVVGGYFRIRLPRGLVYRLTDNFAHYAGILLRMRCGDHGIFCRRTAFIDIGGFPAVPIMEDVEFFRRLHGRGRVIYINKRIAVSPRRYEAVGRTRLTLAYGLIATLYLLRFPLSMLASIYKRTCCRRA
jgi:rSAM/selenodomain-associated transferase 2